MSDLADTIDDLICSFESDGKTMDTLIMYLFCWALVGFVALAVGKFAYSRAVGYATRKSGNASITTAAAANVKIGAALDAAGGGDRKQSHHHRVVPPTPPVGRKRLGSKTGRTSTAVASVAAGLSAVPAAAAANKAFSQEQQQAHHLRPPPVATGNDPDAVRWTNDVFKWLYNAASGNGASGSGSGGSGGGEQSVVDYLLSEWISSLNEYTKKSFAEHGVGVEFVRFLPETHPPVLSNVFCELGVCENITITGDCDATPAMQLKAMRQKGDKVEVSHYRVNVNKLQARLNMSCDTGKKRGQIKFDGWPKVKVILAPVGNIKSNTLDEVQLQDVIIDIVTGAIRSTDLDVDLYRWMEFPTFVKIQQPIITSPLDSYTDRMINLKTESAVKQGEKRLMVKVIKAVGLGLKQGCFEPYCVIEVDDPFQKKQTSTKKNTSSPQWNENFIFTLNLMTEEILFEVYDCDPNGGNHFMGLAIVSVEELLVNPYQRQVLSLQTRPYQDDSVSGTLTLEFIFLEEEEQQQQQWHNAITTKGTPRDVSNAMRSTYNDHYAQETFGSAEHQPRKNAQDDSKNKHISYNINTVFNNKDYLQMPSDHKNPVQDGAGTARGGYYNNPQQQRESETGISVDRHYDIGYNNGIQDGDRGRSRKKKRDFFGAMRTRFSRSKFRSKSNDPSHQSHDQYDGLYGLSPGQARSISADGTRMSSEPSIDLLAPPRAGSARSSLSEMSGASGTSTGTYLNEASTLVLETMENNVKKYYLVPFTQARRNKWRRAGTKLHIFNDHTFVAKHLSNRLNCLVCGKYFPRRIGKQGYECRDCLIKCHKECHVKVSAMCTNSKIHNIDLNNLTVLPSISAGGQ
ncbi:C2 domain,Protein kinase C-like, phorbol ester/diacylglycerol-binding domain [Cinara cedri]|uniref:C2 domain,Protein kinase C-like, phorbol ester/diacylglycerol-binding domain n=1 Tax=Cinara cedri TaxID=506608 RepID=A0A5E4NRC7_9HEMI|nr:C2 domain,Protein kinase C-like, phorbol ester/diacylglycerol-binding domain [Cinara cedri]